MDDEETQRVKNMSFVVVPIVDTIIEDSMAKSDRKRKEMKKLDHSGMLDFVVFIPEIATSLRLKLINPKKVSLESQRIRHYHREHLVESKMNSKYARPYFIPY